MKLEKLPKTKKKSKKRVGRGYGSGKGGHTSGRGQKGQKTRSKLDILFEGTKMRKSLIKRMPFLRGKRRFKSHKNKPIVINLKYLEVFADNQEVTLESLAKYNLVDLQEAKIFGVKILGDGEINKKLIIKLPVSHSAAEKIRKAGGEIKIEEKKPEKKNVSQKSAKFEIPVKKPAKVQKSASKKVKSQRKNNK